MALLPLAGWATDVTVTLYDFTVPYGTELTVDNLPTDARMVSGGATWDQIKEYLTFSSPDCTDANGHVGTYSYTLTKAANTGAYTIYLSSNNAKVTITKADNAVKTAGVLSTGGAYVAAGYDLVTTAPVLDFGTVKYMATTTATVPAADAEGWSTTIPHETLPATYYVYIMAEADPTGNFNALAPQEILPLNSVLITGTEIPGTGAYTCPDGGTLNGTKCTITKDATHKPGEEVKYCPDGWSLVGDKCEKKIDATATDIYSYTCPIGYTG